MVPFERVIARYVMVIPLIVTRPQNSPVKDALVIICWMSAVIADRTLPTGRIYHSYLVNPSSGSL